MNASIRITVKITVYAFLLVAFLIGCTHTHQRFVSSEPLGLPEEIYVAPQQNYPKALKVGLFKFTDPLNAPGLGRASAQYLYRELLKKNVFLNLTLEIDVTDTHIKNLIDIAIAQEYDLIITGDILHYFEGGNYEHSQVEEEIRVLRVIDKRAKTLWYAKAVEVGLPIPSADFIIRQRIGIPAPAATTLIKRNAKKFCNLFLAASPRKQLVSKVTKKGSDRTISDYNQAIEINPQYAKAYYNRGNAWVKKGDYNRACSDWQKACELGACGGLNWAKKKGLCR